MSKKYELTTQFIEWGDKKLFRIKALKSFGSVRANSLGGYIENESNLSQDDTAWVYGNAMVFGNAKVCDNAMVFGDALVGDNAKICDNAKVCGNAKVFDDASIGDDAMIFGDTTVFNNAMVFGYASVWDNAKVYGDAMIFGEASVYGNTTIYGDAKIHGNAIISGNANVGNNASVCNKADYVCVQGLGSAFRSTTFFKCKNGDIGVVCGCFNGNLEEFAKKVRNTHGDNKYAKEYLAMIEVVKIHFEK